jgi:hypothetical protein
VIFLAYKQGLSFEISESRVIEAFFLLIYEFASNLVLPIKIKRLRGFRARVCCLGMNYFRRGKLLTKETNKRRRDSVVDPSLYGARLCLSVGDEKSIGDVIIS